MDATTQLMARIRSSWGDAIVLACAASSVPPSFLAALIANESGGDPGVHRFEKAVLAALWEVLLGRAPAYGSLLRNDILGYAVGIGGAASAGNAAGSASLAGAAAVAGALQRIDGLATSQGLTQVMGYEAIAFHLDGAARLAEPATELPITLRMLGQFADRFQLDLAADFEPLFRCWNSGRPHAPTFDPQYVPNGLARMQAYQGLSQERVSTASGAPNGNVTT